MTIESETSYMILKCLANQREDPYAYFIKAQIEPDTDEGLTKEEVLTRELHFQRFMGAADANLATPKEIAYFQVWEETARKFYKKKLQILYVPAILHFIDQSKGQISGWAPDLTSTPIRGRAFEESHNFEFK